MSIKDLKKAVFEEVQTVEGLTKIAKDLIARIEEMEGNYETLLDGYIEENRIKQARIEALLSERDTNTPKILDPPSPSGEDKGITMRSKMSHHPRCALMRNSKCDCYPGANAEYVGVELEKTDEH